MSRLVEGNGVVMTGGASLRPAAKTTALPTAATPQGLYDPLNERDSCGVGFIVNLHNRKSHRIIEDGLRILENLNHRGAVGADPLVGDGAGMLVQIPHTFFAARGGAAGLRAARPGPLCGRPHLHAAGRRSARRHGSRSSTRASPTRARCCSAGATCRSTTRACRTAPEIAIERALPPPGLHRPRPGRHRRRGLRAPALSSCARSSRRASSQAYGGLKNDFYIVSMSCRTVVYKGMFLAYQLGAYYRDLHDPRFRVGAGARPPALLDQHLPVLAARPPLPDGRPQRRDQHRPRQRQLDGGAPGERLLARCSATTSPSSGRSRTRASRTPPASTTRSSSWCAAAIRCRMRR